MPTVQLDFENNHEVTEIIGGVELQRIARVTGLTAAPEGQLLEALRDPGVPQIGEQWPNEIWFVIRREAFPDGPNAARIVLTYGDTTHSTWNQPEPVGNDGADVKQVSSFIVEEESTEDRGGTPMTLSPPARLNTLPEYRSTAKVQRPAGTLLFERLEKVPPTSRMRALVGTLNQFTIGAYAAETLLCTRIDAQSDDGGRQWRTTYEFRQRSTWQHFDRWRAPDNTVPTDSDEVGFDVIPVADFSVLDLDFTDNQTPI